MNELKAICKILTLMATFHMSISAAEFDTPKASKTPPQGKAEDCRWTCQFHLTDYSLGLYLLV